VLRPCSICGVLSRGARGARHPLTRSTATERGLGSTWQRIAWEQVKREPWCSCPGCSLHSGPCNAEQDLTADHVVPRSRAGSASDGVVTLCRRCNSAKDSTRKGVTTPGRPAARTRIQVFSLEAVFTPPVGGGSPAELSRQRFQHSRIW
jgi:5-methylcytosine-specific restriction endonuclease McrA